MKPLSNQHLATMRRHMVEMVDIQFDVMADEIGKSTPDERVRAAMLQVPRHLFVPQELAAFAYQDTPLPIGFDKTISQPFIAALMLDLLALEPSSKVLEIGTGLGYQTAIIAALAAQVWSVEIVEEFAEQASVRLAQLGYTNVALRVGDGSRGWAEHAPFDRILVTAAVSEPPKALLAQLNPAGRMVLPIGDADSQQLSLIEKSASDDLAIRAIIPARFTQLETTA